jgi:diguanylate cyclase (GGDEF)-like protein/PAS domain S-box-containing protein
MSLSGMLIEDSWILNTLMDNTGESIYIKDRDSRIWRVSRKMAADMGVADPVEIYGKTDIDLFGKEFGEKTRQDELQVMETGKPIMGAIEKYINKSGGINWTSTTKLALRNEKGKIIGLLGITREINELKDSEIEFQWLATHDLLTSLDNRFLLLDHIQQAIFRARRINGLFAILFIDLNEFKRVNDLKGHDKGDQILIKIGQLLKKNVHSSDTVARIGGDEFVILLDGISKGEDSIIVAKRITELLSVKIDEEDFSVTAAIGISTFPKDGEDAETLLKAADQAMYEAKKGGLPYKFV